MLIKKNNNKGESIMKRYRLNTKNFSKAKRGIRGGEYYLEKPCLLMFQIVTQFINKKLKLIMKYLKSNEINIKNINLT
jgi:hypothetical protein